MHSYLIKLNKIKIVLIVSRAIFWAFTGHILHKFVAQFCCKTGQFSVIFKQIAKIITITLYKKNYQKMSGLETNLKNARPRLKPSAKTRDRDKTKMAKSVRRPVAHSFFFAEPYITGFL